MRENDSAADAAMDQLTRTTPSMDTSVAATLLREAKEIMDEHGVVFFLRQGTCLGAIRDNAFISWDDDVDIGSIEGLHGFDERTIEPVADSFRAHGFHGIDHTALWRAPPQNRRIFSVPGENS